MIVSLEDMEDGKEVLDVRKEDGVVDKLGSEVDELRGGVEVEESVGVKSENEGREKENSESDEKVRDGRESIKEDNENNEDVMKDDENAEEVSGNAVEVSADANVEAVLEGVRCDEISQMEVKEEIKQNEGSNNGEIVHNVAVSDGKDVRQEETFDVKELKEHNGEEVVHNVAVCDGKGVRQEEASDVKELKQHNDEEEIQQLEKPVVQEENENQDVEIQIDNPATEVKDHNSSENVENVPADPSSAVMDKGDHAQGLGLPVVAECQPETILPEATVNSVFATSFVESNAAVESDGDKLDVLSQVDFDTDVQPESGMSQMEWNSTNEKVDISKEDNFETPEKQIQQVKMENLKVNKEQLNSSLYLDGDESGTEEEQVSFFREVETFFKTRGTDFRPPKFYGEPLNLLKYVHLSFFLSQLYDIISSNTLLNLLRFMI